MAKDSVEKQPEAIPAAMAGTPEQEIFATPLVTAPAGETRTSERREIARSASLVMLGNLGSSIMGMVRQIVVVAIGSSVAGPFNSAILPAQTFNDFLINGSVSGALIPTFNDYSAPEKRDELRRIVFTIVNLVLIVMFVAAVLYALKEFAWPAFATASYHVGIIIGAFAGSLLGARYYGHLGLAFGVLLGAAGEIALLLPGIRDQRLRYMFVLDLKHPALQRILNLYAPVALSFLVSMGIIFFDQHLASLTPGDGAASFTAMRAATTLIQFPVGLVAAALSFAVLPTLSAHAREGDMERFKATLLLGFRIGLLLMIPAAAGLIILRVPIVDLLFMHHKYTAQNAALTAVALQNYAYQLPFVAIDQLLIAAFYARKNTIIPVTVGIAGVVWYLLIALPFWQTVGMPALVLANTFQNAMHPVIMLILLRLAIGSLHVRSTIPTVLKILLSSAIMVAVAWGLQLLLGHIPLFSLQHLLGQLLTVLVAGGLAGGVYVGLVKTALLAKLGRK